MRLIDHSFHDPVDNVLFDEWLLRNAAEQGEALRLWESPSHCVVLGLAGRVDQEIQKDTVRRDDIPVLRRTSGGGTVLQGPGCLNYSFILAKSRHPDIADLRRSYLWIMNIVIDALSGQDIVAKFYPVSDLAVKLPGHSPVKISGNAQKRGKNFILHHGTLLYDFDLSLISRYLSQPPAMPEYRVNRSHEDFVTNVPLDPEIFKEDLSEKVGARQRYTVSIQDEQKLHELRILKPVLIDNEI